ncbi:MAG TPA: hypothetical protein VFW45_05835, partial [Candidatus Polarisedimenticolia bacterium]|nr:hypothetical protein [Candidatus Polarisedimenticolia bacterium]
LLPPEGVRYNISGDVGGPPTLSPDGSMVAYAAISKEGASRLWVRRLDSLASTELAGTEGATFPAWSPDNRSIAFFSDGKLKRVDLAGGNSFALCDAPTSRGASWGEAGILFEPSYRSELHLVAPGGGPSKAVTKLDPARHSTHRWPQLLPDGRHFIYLAATHQDLDAPNSGIYFDSLDGGEGKMIVQTASSAQFAAGHLLYIQGGTLVAQPFDPTEGKLLGNPVPMRENVRLDGSTWKSIFSASDSGLLLYEPARAGSGNQFLKQFSRSGALLATLGGRSDYLNIQMSRDGKRVVLEAQDTPRSDLWVHDLARNSRIRLSFDPSDEVSPIWSADETMVLYSTDLDGIYNIYEKRADGSGQPREIVGLKEDSWPMDVSADGRYLVLGVGKNAVRTRSDLWILPLKPPGQPVPFRATEYSEQDARFSPDGRAIAYVSNETGKEEVYVTTFDPAALGSAKPEGGRWQISTAGGSCPRWRSNGQELYYRKADNATLVAVPVSRRGDSLEFGTETPLFSAPQRWDVASFDPAPDGQSFVVNVQGSEQDRPLVLVTDWPDTLKGP